MGPDDIEDLIGNINGIPGLGEPEDVVCLGCGDRIVWEDDVDDERPLCRGCHDADGD